MFRFLLSLLGLIVAGKAPRPALAAATPTVPAGPVSPPGLTRRRPSGPGLSASGLPAPAVPRLLSPGAGHRPAHAAPVPGGWPAQPIAGTGGGGPKRRASRAG